VEAHEDLLEIIAANLRAEGTGVGDEVEQLAAGNELLSDVGDLGLSAVLVSVHRVWLDSVVLDQRRVVQLTCLLNFGLTELDEFLVEVGLVLLEDLEGDLAAVNGEMTNAVSEKVSAIVLGMGDPKEFSAGLKAAKDASIPVFGLDAGSADGVTTNFTSDNTFLGETSAKALLDARTRTPLVQTAPPQGLFLMKVFY